MEVFTKEFKEKTYNMNYMAYCKFSGMTEEEANEAWRISEPVKEEFRNYPSSTGLEHFEAIIAHWISLR